VKLLLALPSHEKTPWKEEDEPVGTQANNNATSDAKGIPPALQLLGSVRGTFGFVLESATSAPAASAAA
jgi:hypothetical protein